jgi:tetratricopeptide (TPR) repeat protein
MLRNILIFAIGASLLLIMPAARADQRDPRLPALFEALKTTDDLSEGERIGRRIALIWSESRRDGIDEVMAQGQNFMTQGNLHLALGNFTSVTKIAPDFAEGWNKRATALYKMGELEAAARNVGQVLALEPRHFLALAGLGVIYLRTGHLEDALYTFEIALMINPHLPGTRQAADQVRRRLGKI